MTVPDVHKIKHRTSMHMSSLFLRQRFSFHERLLSIHLGKRVVRFICNSRIQNILRLSIQKIVSHNFVSLRFQSRLTISIVKTRSFIRTSRVLLRKHVSSSRFAIMFIRQRLFICIDDSLTFALGHCT